LLKVLDLFSGIGGFSLGLERTGGFETVAFCEIDPFCRRVLAKHWPHVRQFEDVTKLKGEDVGPVDVICGGFPCQDISFAGKGAGLAGERSGLWREYARLIGELRPVHVVVENVAALLSRGLADVLGDLAALGYDAEWHCIPASSVGAPHRRDRVWIVANPRSVRRDRNGSYVRPQGCAEGWSGVARSGDGKSTEVSYATHYAALSAGIRRRDSAGQWRLEPAVGRVAHGVPNRVDRLRALGNAVVPQIPELIGRAILQARAAA